MPFAILSYFFGEYVSKLSNEMFAVCMIIDFALAFVYGYILNKHEKLFQKTYVSVLMLLIFIYCLAYWLFFIGSRTVQAIFINDQNNDQITFPSFPWMLSELFGGMITDKVTIFTYEIGFKSIDEHQLYDTIVLEDIMMLKIDYVSDLHVDNAMMGGPYGTFGQFLNFSNMKNDDSDVLVIAGDTANHPKDMADVLNEASKHYRLVVATLGNHELTNNVDLYSLGLEGNVSLLDLFNDHCFLDGTRLFIGGNLAPTDLAVDEVIANVLAAQNHPLVNDVVIVSHYIPDRRICDDIERSNHLISGIKDAKNVSAIIFGHYHYEIDQMIDGFRCLSNPRGYQGIKRDGMPWGGLKAI